jgi:glycosyltransferase involved in cell wall biosynthesis
MGRAKLGWNLRSSGLRQCGTTVKIAFLSLPLSEASFMTSRFPPVSEGKNDALNPGSQVVICIPAYNESTVIGEVVQKSKSFTPNVLVCDDGSTDATSAEAANRGATVLKHSTNRGKGAALRTLLWEAAKLRPSAVVTLDGDGQHDPCDIPKLVGPVLRNTADVVIGSRFGAENHVPFYRRFGNSFLTLLTNWIAGTRLQDTQSGFRAYASRVLPSLSIEDNGMGVDSQILIQLARKGFRIQERKVSVIYSGDTSTFNPLSHMIRVIWSISRGNHPGGKRALSSVWTPALVVLLTVSLVFGLFMPSFSWLVMTTSSLTLGVAMIAMALGQNTKLNRWFRRAR